MRSLWSLLLFLLLDVAKADVDSSYQLSSGFRPDNITGLNYEVYSHTGSYYNGTLTFALHLTDPNNNNSFPSPSDDDPSVNPCAAYINSTIEVTLNAVAGITMSSATGAITNDSLPYANFTDGNNPIRVEIWGWTAGADLTNFTYDLDADTGTYPYVSFFSQGRYAPIWDISLGASSPSQYSFLTLPSNLTAIPLLGISLNLTHSCSNSTTSVDSANADKYLYEGGLLAPFNGNQSTLPDYPWADSIPYPSMTGQFDGSTAHINVAGLFDMNTLSGSIVGSANITFSGTLDAVRSDQLLLGEARPEWNATLGFSEKSSAVSNAASSGFDTLGRMMWVYLGIMLLCTL